MGGVDKAMAIEPQYTETRECRRSLAFHRALAKVLLDDPECVYGRASAHLGRLERLHPHAAALWVRWRSWLALPPPVLAERLMEPGPLADEMRHVSPFAGILSARERRDVLLAFRRGER